MSEILMKKRQGEILTKKQNNSDLVAGLEYAALLQQAILLKQRHFNRIFSDSFLLYKPFQMVSGDFYWLSETDDLVYLAVGDCMGHGVRGAMLSVLAHSLLDYAILNKNLKKTYKILREFDKRFLESFTSSENSIRFNNDWIDISLCCIDRTKKMIFFSGAKHSIIHVNKEGSTQYKGCNYSIGSWQIKNIRPYETIQIPYKEGDTLYLFSDGYYTQFGGQEHKKFKFSNFKSLLNFINPLPMLEQYQQINQVFDDWRGNLEMIDDVCVIGVKL